MLVTVPAQPRTSRVRCLGSRGTTRAVPPVAEDSVQLTNAKYPDRRHDRDDQRHPRALTGLTVETLSSFCLLMTKYERSLVEAGERAVDHRGMRARSAPTALDVKALASAWIDTSSCYLYRRGYYNLKRLVPLYPWG